MYQDFDSQQQWWCQTFATVQEKRQMISTQIERVGQDYPELVATFDLLLAYIGHLHNHLHGSMVLPALPGSFCDRNPLICKCAGGDQNACNLLGGGIVEQEIEPLTCNDLWQQYVDAKSKERAELLKAVQVALNSGKPLQVAAYGQLKNVINTQSESDKLLQILKERGCIIPSTLP